MNPTSTNDVIVQEIIVNAPAKRVFEALTDPDQRVKWWGAEGRFQTTQMESDLRPGEMGNARQRYRRQAVHHIGRVPGNRSSAFAGLHMAIRLAGGRDGNPGTLRVDRARWRYDGPLDPLGPYD
jgi:hypothetical protein